MNRIAAFLSAHARAGWVAIGLSALLVAVTVWLVDTDRRSHSRQSLLETEAQRSALEIMAGTIHGNLMGAITLLGIMDPDIKQDATNGLLSVDASIGSKLGLVGGVFGARGVFVLSGDGVAKTSWSRAGKPMSGQDARYLPYHQTAMQGQSAVYAAIGSASGERTLYFAAPVFAEAARATSGVGAVVAQAPVEVLDELLRHKANMALLLSPQGVVFASSKDEWVGRLEGPVSNARVEALRGFRPFAAWFDKTEPRPLPVLAVDGIQRLDGGRFAVATAAVDWNDPAGPWKLVLLEDLSETVTAASTARRTFFVTLAYGLLAWMVMQLFRGRQRQGVAALALQQLAADQQRQVRLRTQMVAAVMRLQQCNGKPELAQVFLSQAHALFGVLQGRVYARSHEATEVFELLASFACAKQPAATLRAGEGLLGQCALDRQPRVMASVDGSQSLILSGLGSAKPSCTVMLALSHNGGVAGVVEVDSLGEPAHFLLDAFTELANALALNLHLNPLQNQGADHSPWAKRAEPALQGDTE